MLLVTLEIVPHGCWEDKYKIKQIYIGNVGGNPTKGNYDVWFDVDPTEPGFRPKPHLHLKGFKRVKGAQELVRQILNLGYTKAVKKEKRNAKSRSAKACSKPASD